MINKHCLNLFIDPNIPYVDLIDQFTNIVSQKYVFCKSAEEADVIISCEKLNDKIHILIDNSDKSILTATHDYAFQPYLNGKNGDINTLGVELSEFVGFIVDDYNLPYKKDNTILIVR